MYYKIEHNKEPTEKMFRSVISKKQEAKYEWCISRLKWQEQGHSLNLLSNYGFGSRGFKTLLNVTNQQQTSSVYILRLSIKQVSLTGACELFSCK